MNINLYFFVLLLTIYFYIYDIIIMIDEMEITEKNANIIIYSYLLLEVSYRCNQRQISHPDINQYSG